MVTEKEIAIEIRCRRCGKLLFKVLNCAGRRRMRKVTVLSRCTRCGRDNRIEI